MINLHLQVRRAAVQDHRQISSLIFHEASAHRHLDWRSAIEWIGEKNYWVLEDHGLVIAALACPEDPRNVAWIRLFAHHPQLPSAEAWSALWEIAHSDIFSANPQAQVSAIILKQWFQTLLLSSGFKPKQDIVLLRLNNFNHQTPKLPPGVRIRAMQKTDLPTVTALDYAAFGDFWCNSLDALERAHSQALHATVAEDDSGVIGYQISTGNPFGAHLARLGVQPEAQGRGVGSALVQELIHQLGSHSSASLSVNTQGDNTASLMLYQKLGFARTGETFPVFAYSRMGAE
ncbi:MAG: GNAT family N-acetyltransferase [Anaerolineales bacterium]|jgi:ribosomal protein S18 acetylase RimI-like enzyme|nr:GNAT family N-acetyltransferase [Anaerolineales bacterium]